MTKETEEYLKNSIIKLFNASAYNIRIDNERGYIVRVILTKENKTVLINVNKQNYFLKLKGNECLDLEKNPKKQYYINYDDIEFLSRTNRLNYLLNDL